MGSKLNPGVSDCYAEALPDEPMFVLLARDPSAPEILEQWAAARRHEVQLGRRSLADINRIAEAMNLAADMREWRKVNDGKWRAARTLPDSVDPAGVRAEDGT
jgi:hypothetical protein